MKAGWMGACASALLVVACSKGPEKARAPQAVPVRVAKVQERAVPLTLQAVGTVEASNLISVRPQVGGVVTQVAFREGQEVEKGQLLFQIDPRPYQAALQSAQQTLARDRALAEAAQADLARYQKLVEKEFVTREQYDQKVAAAASSKATLGADQAAVDVAKLNLAYCAVRAPDSGRTGQVLVRQGNLVKANDDNALVTIARVKPVLVSFSIPEAKIEALRAKQTALATFVTPKLAQTPIEGKLTFINNTVDTATGTLLLKAEFPNQDERLWPGQYVDVRLELGTDPHAVTVPVEAVQTGQGGTYVFVVEGGKAQQRPVKLARQTSQLAVIDQGLKPGETVVTDGQLRLVSGAQVTVSGEQGAESAQATGGAGPSTGSGRAGAR